MVYNFGVMVMAKTTEYRQWLKLPYELLYDRVKEVTDLGNVSYPLSNPDVEEIICKSCTAIEVVTELCAISRGMVLRARIEKEGTVRADATVKRDMLVDVLSAVKRRWDTASRVATLRMGEFGRSNYRSGKGGKDGK